MDQSNTVSFTTDSQTTRVAILFSAYSPGINSSIQLDAITMSDPISCNNDIDSDGIPNGLDLDSDNDGIYDVIESGNEALDTNFDGVINGLDAGFNDSDLNGAHDASESNTLIDSDSDGTIDAFELDSDKDGCSDSEEAGYTDPNSDGILGGSPITQDSKGKVTSGTDGYTTPQDLNSDNTFDYRDSSYDVGCYNPALIVVKSAVVSDTNSNGLNDVGDVINYTVVVTNTGGLPITFTSVDDQYTNGSETKNLTLNWSSSSTETIVTSTENLFYYSNRVDDSDYQWNEQNGNNGSPEYQWGYPPGVEYYFDSSSGVSYSEVDYVFTTNGFGTTRSPYQYSNTDPKVSKYSRISNQNVVGYYVYEDISLEANTTYTVSVYAAAPNNTYFNTNNDYEKLRFVHRPPGGSDIFGDYNRVTGPVSNASADNDSGWTRYHHTFTTGNAGSYRVGFSAPYFGNNYTRIWGAQLEKGSSPTRLTYTYNNRVSSTATSTGFADPRLAPLPSGASAIYTGQLTITQEMLDAGTEISNQVTITGSFTSPGGISGEISDVSADDNNNDGNTEDDPTIVSLNTSNELTVTKIASVSDENSNNLNDVGDIVTYKINIKNTGNTNLNSFTITDTLEDSTGQILIQITDTASFTLAAKTNLFTRSNRQDDTDYEWNEEGNIDGNPLQYYGHPKNEPYYFSANSGIAYSSVDYNFPVNGLGYTKNNNNSSDSESGAHSRIHDNNQLGSYYYQDVNLEANTTYTVSTYASAYNSNYDDPVTSEQMRFVYRPPGGSDSFSDYITLQTYDAWDWSRYSYTFTTGAAGTYRVGIDPPYAQGNGARFWGAQLERGGTPSVYVYTYTSTDSAPSEKLPVNTEGNTSAYVAWPGTVPNRNGIDALMVQHDNDILDYPIGNGYWSMIEVEPENFTNFDNRPTSSHFDNYGPYTYNGHRYYIETTTWSWTTHRNNAQAAGGYLWVPNTKEEWDYIRSVIPTNNWIWTGVYQQNNSDYQADQQRGGWKALDGSYVPMPGESTVLSPGAKVEYEFEYTIAQEDVDDGMLINQFYVLANGSSGIVSDTSDDGDDTDGNTKDDPTVIEISKISSITIVKTATVSDVNGDGLNGVGDIIEYTIVVTNTGNTRLTSSTILDSLTDGLGNIRSLNSTVTYISTTATITIQETKLNLFTYSNRIDDVDFEWNESSGIDGNIENEWGYPPGIDYYFDTSSGRSYSEVDHVFTTNGLGTTRSPYLYAGTDQRVHMYSRIDNNQRANDYIYQDVTLEANTEYTVSVYAAAYSTSYVNSSNNYDQLSFVYRPPGGSDSYSPRQGLTGWVQSNNASANNDGWARYYYTFTTGAAGNYRVGFTPVYNGNQGGRFWGAQLEKGSSPTRLIYTYNSKTPSYNADVDTVTTTIDNNEILEARSVDTYVASYTITQDDVDSKFLSNTATFTGIDPDGSTVVSKTSDDGDESNGDNSPTIITLASTSTIEVIKTASILDVNNSEVNDVGDIITYTIVVSNTGYTTVNSLTLDDTLIDYNSSSLSYNQPISFLTATSGSTSVSLDVAGVVSFTASYTITQSDVDSGGVSNTILILGSSSGLSDNVTATNEISTDLTDATPGLELTKQFTTTDVNGNNKVDLGDIIIYTISAENTGNVELSGLTFTDTMTTYFGESLTLSSGPSYSSSTDASTSSGTIAVGETETYEASFTITQQAIDAGGVYNTISAVASSPTNSNNVSDTSDNGDDTDGNTTDDITDTEFDVNPKIRVTKTADVQDVNGNTISDVGDIIVYEILISNVGDMKISSLSLVDTISDSNGNVLTLNEPLSSLNSSSGSSSSTLLIRGSTTYTTSYTITQSDLNAGSVINNVVVTGSSSTNSNNVSNTSEVETILATVSPVIEITKIASITDNGDGVNGVGDIVNYYISVENKGNVPVENPDIEDILTDGNGNTLSLTVPLTYQSTTKTITTNLGVGAVDFTSTGNGKWDGQYPLSDAGYDYAQYYRNGFYRSLPNSSTVKGLLEFNDGRTVQAGYTYVGAYEGHSYMRSNSSITWTNQRDVAISIGGYLVNITSEGEREYLNTVLPNSWYWVGLYQDNTDPDYSEPAGGWKWLDGKKEEKLGSNIWPNNEPNDTSNSNSRGYFYITSNSIRTADRPNTGSYKYIVEFDDGRTSQAGFIRLNGTFEGHTYFVSSSVVTWDVAKATAESLGGYLLVLDSSQEWGWIRDQEPDWDDFINSNPHWIGLSQDPNTYDFSEPQGGWRWVNGVPLQGPLTTYTVTNTIDTDNVIGVDNIDRYTAKYLITQSDFDSGSISNVVSLTGSSPSRSNDAYDVSDDGVDNDGNTTDDPTQTLFSASPLMEVTKVATITDVNGNGENDLNDIIEYSIYIHNKGNVNLSTPTLVDYLSDGVATDLTSQLNGPTYHSQTLSPTTINFTVTVAQVDGSNKYFIDGAAQKELVLQKGYIYRFDQSNNTNSSHPLYLSTTSDGTHNSGVSYTTSVTVVGTPGNAGAYTEIYVVESTPTLYYYCSAHSGMGGKAFTIGSVVGQQGIIRPNEVMTYTASYTISGASASTAFISNIVTVTTSSPGNSNDIIDLADDGDDTDGNSQNDPTIVDLIPAPEMELTKTGTITFDNGDGMISPGDRITYTIKLENTGNLLINNISLTDTMVDGNGVPLNLDSGPTFVESSQGSINGILQLTEVATYTAVYTITNSTANSGLVSNSIYAVGSAGGLSNNVTETSDDGDDTDGNTEDDPTVIQIPELPSIEVTKTYSTNDLNSNGVIDLGDRINYIITIENTGNQDLTGLNLNDTFTNLTTDTLSLSSGPSYSSSTHSNAQGLLVYGEKETYVANYIIEQLAIDGAGVRNSVLATISSPGNSNNVTDTSDDGDDTDGNTQDDATITEFSTNPSIEVTKTAQVNDTNSNGRTDKDDIITYTITVENTGDTQVDNISFNDIITTSTGFQLSLTANPARISTSAGSTLGTLLIGETAIYTAQFIIDQTAYDAQFISNTVTVTADAIGQTGNVSDTSDDGDDSDGNTEDDPTITVMTPQTKIEVTKTFTVVDGGDGEIDVGDTVRFSITVENTGNAPLNGITIEDVLKDGDGNVIALSDGPYYVSGSQGSSEGNLLNGETGTYVAFFIVTQQAFDSGSVSNVATATGSSEFGTNNVIDVSDDGNDLDGNTTDDPTEVIITSQAKINVEKTASVFDEGDGFVNVGDTINYVITVTNSGATPLSSITLTDILTDNASNTLTLTNGPNFVSASQGSSSGTLNIGEIATYSASYLIEAAAASSGAIYNQVQIIASSPGQLNDVSDTSDDGDDSDGNTTDDPTVIEMDFSPIIDVTKTATVIDNNSNSLTDLGDTIVYQITVNNIGNVTLSSLTITDTITDVNITSLTLSSGPDFVSSSLSSAEGTLLVGESATYSATFIINQQSVDSGGVLNSVYAVASSPGNSNNVSDTSDDGDDSDGNTADDKTEVGIDQSLIIEATKTASVIDNNTSSSTDLGDTIVYTITVENKGNVTLRDVVLTDTLLDGNGSPLSLTAGPTFISSTASSAQGTLTVGETATYTASYTIAQAALDTGGVSNSVLVTGSSPGQSNNVTDTSDDGDDSDGNTEDDTTDTSIDNSPSLEVTKTSAITDNGDGVVGKGDVVQYTISVINNGNVTLSSLTVSDVLSDLNSGTLSLSFGPSFSGSSQGSAQGTLKVGETANYIAYFIINQTAVDAGGISNQASATASSPGNSNDVSDMSDDGDDSDGNTTDDPTVTSITASSLLEVTKTAAVTDNGDGETGAGDVINYTITVENKGNVTLTGLTLVDTLTDGSGGSLTLTNGPSFSSTTLGSSPGTLKPDEIATYSGYYIISSAAALTSSVNNSVLATASSPGQTNNVTDTSDDGDDSDGNTEDDVTVVGISPNPGIEATKTAVVIDSNSNSSNDQGDIIVYTITTENTGNVTLTGISLTDTLTDNAGNVLSLSSGPTFTSASSGSSEGILRVGETATYTASYTIEADAAATGSIKNRVLVTSSSPGNTDDVIDISDNGDDNDGNTLNDHTVVLATAEPKLEATKTATVTDNNGDGNIGAGDSIVYTITVENTGGITLSNITLNDVLTDGNGGNLPLTSGPSLTNATAGSSAATLQATGVLTYTATYTISNEAANTPSINNRVTVTASSPGQSNNVTDVSDDGDDSDGNTQDDPTVVSIDAVPLLEVTKTASVTDDGDGITGSGDVINYVITIENKGNVTLSSLTVTDSLTDGNGGSLVMGNGPYFSGSDQGSGLGTLLPGEVSTYRAYYIITDASAASGQISNIATATASSPGNSNDVFDQSDDGDDSDGNTVDDPTVVDIVPNTSMEITKTAIVIDNGDGVNGASDKVVYTITVNNTGDTSLTGVTISDTLTDANGTVLSLDAGPTFTSASSGSSQGSLVSGEIATYTATYTIIQNVANTGSISNIVTGTASSPGQSNNVTDTSDDGDDSDGNTVDDPTVVNTQSSGGVEVTKTASVVDTNGNGNNDQGDVIVYTITVANTGSVTLSGLSLTDTLTDGSGGSLSLTSGPTFNSNSASSAEGSLAVGEISTYTATYTISQNAANTGSVNNSVSVTASTPGNSNDVTDVSDNGDDTDGNTTNDVTVVLTSSDSSIEVTKTAVVNDTNSNNKTDQGDVIVYSITVRNTGNITLSSITISDTLTDGNGGSLSLDSGPTFVSNSGSSAQGTLISGEIATYTATYTISAAAENTPSVNNTAQAIASTPGNSNDVTDVSDNGNDGDGNTTNDPTVVNITASPQMEVTKEGTVTDDGDGILGVGDTVNYTIRIENQGNVNITEPLLVDTFTDALSNTLALSSGPTFNFADLGSSQGIIKPNETAHYGATFVITQAVVDAGGLINSVTVTASSTGNPGGLSDVSDDGDDTDGNTTDDTTVLVINPAPIIETTKTATVIDNNSNGLNDLGDTIVYTITVENKGNVTLSGLSLADTLTDGDGGSLSLTSGPTFNSSTASSAQGTLTVGETASYTATYTVTQDAVDSGSVVNTAMATASSPQNTNDVTDRSDNGDDSDGETQDDNTVVVLSRSSQLEATKTASVIDNNTSSSTDLGDTIVYTITVENKGNVTLRDVVLTDTLLDGNGSPLSLTAGPTFISSTASSAQGTLTVGETATYTASYTIAQAALDTGGVSNSVLVTGSSPGQSNNVTDTSDDGDDSDGNTEDDTTDTSIDNSPSLEVTKTSAITDNGDGVVGKGDVVQYTISVINNGNVTLSSLTVVDVLSDATGTTLSLNSGPSFSGSSQGSAQGTLKVGETASYSALYIITQAAVDAGGLSNQASATASSPGNSNDVSDMSDDGDDSDGNTTDDPTVTSITASSLLEITKTAAITDNGGDGNTGSGDIINYTITVENKGNVTLTGLTLVDTLTDGSGGSLTLTNGPSFSSTTLGSSPGTLKPDEIATYSGYYIISSAAALTSSVNNSVLATASSPGQTNNVTDTSDDGDDSDGNTEDDVTVVEITPLPEIEATKTATTIDNNSNGIVDLGDTIVYTITVENKGNTSLSSLTLVDTLSDGSGGSLTLTSGPTFTSSSAGSSQGTLTLGEIATYTASYVVSSVSERTGFISNTVNVTASSPGNIGDVTDTSDDGDDTDGNTTDDPTIVTITPLPGIEATKTVTITDNGDGLLGKGDFVRYDIEVTNTGNINLHGVSIFDQFLDNNGRTLNLISGPTYTGANLGSVRGKLKSK